MTDIGRFDPGVALAALDAISSGPNAAMLPSAEKAWEAAWIACLTSSRTWARKAEGQFADVLIEIKFLAL